MDDYIQIPYIVFVSLCKIMLVMQEEERKWVFFSIFQVYMIGLPPCAQTQHTLMNTDFKSFRTKLSFSQNKYETEPLFKKYQSYIK